MEGATDGGGASIRRVVTAIYHVSLGCPGTLELEEFTHSPSLDIPY